MDLALALAICVRRPKYFRFSVWEVGLSNDEVAVFLDLKMGGVCFVEELGGGVQIAPFDESVAVLRHSGHQRYND